MLHYCTFLHADVSFYVCTAEYIDVVRNREMLSTLLLFLECDVDFNVPRPIPLPLLSWFKDGELVSSAHLNDFTTIDESFLTTNPILKAGVFDIVPFMVLSDGTAVFTTKFNNITSPVLGNLPPDITPEQARELLFNTYLGNWTCFVNNSIGSSSVEYIVRKYGMY